MRTKILLGLVLAVVGCGNDGDKGEQGAPGMTGPKGDPGPAPEPAAGAIVPRVGLIDREMDVVVTVDDAKLDANTTFDFGAGVTVSNPQIVSSTTAFVHLKIDAAATLGERDVKITIGTKMLVAMKGFVIKPAIDVKTDSAGAQQGAFALIDIQNNDTTNAFAPSSLSLVGTNGLEFDSSVSVTATNALAVMLVDPLAPVGNSQVTASNNATGNKVLKTFLSASDAVKITARTPTPLTIGTPKTGENLPMDFSTNLYKYTSTTAGIITLNVTATGLLADPFMYAYPTSGRRADILGIFDSFGDLIYPVDGNTNDGYIIGSDFSYGGGVIADFGYDLSVTKLEVATTAEQATAHATPLTAQAFTLAAAPADAAVLTGNISAGGEVDVYSITLADGDDIQLSVQGDADVRVSLTTATADVLDPALYSLPALGAARSAFNDDFVDADATWYVVVTGVTTGKKPTGKYVVGVRRLP
jgi:hypothetical protein